MYGCPNFFIFETVNHQTSQIVAHFSSQIWDTIFAKCCIPKCTLNPNSDWMQRWSLCTSIVNQAAHNTTLHSEICSTYIYVNKSQPLIFDNRTSHNVILVLFQLIMQPQYSTYYLPKIVVVIVYALHLTQSHYVHSNALSAPSIILNCTHLHFLHAQCWSAVT